MSSASPRILSRSSDGSHHGVRRRRKPRTSSRRIGGQVLAETLAIEVVERVAMAAFFLGHVVEDTGGGVIFGPQPVSEALVDARVFFFVRDREREHLALGEVG